MKKAMKKAKEKAGRIVDSLLPASRSQLSAPADPDCSVISSTPFPLEQRSEAGSHHLNTAAESAVVQRSSQIVGASQPTPPPDQELIPSVHFLAEPQSGLAMLNNNQNRTYNFGRDVLNYNPVTNHIYSIATEKNAVKIMMGNRFVPAALLEVQPEEAGCMHGTRTRVLSMFMEWAKNDPMRIFWLAGLAGTGKTSIAVTLSRMLQEEPSVLLGGTFFCSRTANIPELTDARCIFPTLATALSERSTVFEAALTKELNADSRVTLKPATVQITALLQQPLSALASLSRSIVFVIDALDECSDEHEVKKLLLAISTLNCDAKVKFILTSRPETHINTSLPLSSNRNSILRLHTIDTAEVTEDIRIYIDDAFSKSQLAKPWYSDTDIKTLATLSDGLFIFASTIIAYILDVNSVRRRETRLKTVLSAVQESKVAMAPLDAMYEFVLTRASDAAKIEPKELEEMLQVLACILVARVPLSVSALADLLGLESDELQDSLQRLHALVHVPDHADHPGLRTLHASFGDYLFARNRISPSLGNEGLARGSLRVMSERLRFNVCNIQSSYETNPEVKPCGVTLSLEYACIHWIYHAVDLATSTRLNDAIEQLFCPNFLFWLEVMSVLGRISRAAAMLLIATSMVQHAELSRFFRDARAFVASSQEAIARSAAHIYVSALPFAAKDSLIHRRFTGLFTGLISVDMFGIDRHGGQIIMSLTGHTKSVTSVAYSPDGSLLASGSTDGNLRIWSTRSGEDMISPLNSHARAVYSVAFAPNGKNLAAGTSAGEVRIWDISTVQASSRRLRGHSSRVHSVKFSPDGAFIASASADKTVRLWSFQTGKQVCLMEGHEGEVHTVAFSPTGNVIASGSDDGTIRLWQSATGQPVGKMLVGGSIPSLSFSPDGTTLASSCHPSKIQLWSTQTGECIRTLSSPTGWVWSEQFSPDGRALASATGTYGVRLWTIGGELGEFSSLVLKGDSDFVNSVAFSPDGLHVASASADGAVRIWDASIGQAVLQPLPAHDDGVYAVAVSADGGFIVSGSDDNSVRIWNTRAGEPKLLPLLGHTEYVRSVAVSTDGRLIASASGDCTVRLWDAQTGGAVSEPLQGHEGVVNAVIFSSDALWLASGSDDATVRIWDVATRKPSSLGPLNCDDQVFAVAFSADHQLIAAGGHGGKIYLWDIETGQSAHQSSHESEYIRSIAFSSSGTHLACGGDDRVVRVCEVSTGRQIFALEGHSGYIRSITFSPNSQLIGTGSDDQTIRLWDAQTGSELAIMRGHGDCALSVVFTPDGKSIISGSLDSTIRVWNVEAALLRSSENDENPASILENNGLKNGWIVNQSGEMLLWIPVEYRACLNLQTCTTLIAKHRITIRTGETWHHGDRWTECCLGFPAAQTPLHCGLP